MVGIIKHRNQGRGTRANNIIRYIISNAKIYNMRLKGMRLSGQRPDGMRLYGQRIIGMPPDGMRLKGRGSRERGLSECGPTEWNRSLVPSISTTFLCNLSKPELE